VAEICVLAAVCRNHTLVKHSAISRMTQTPFKLNPKSKSKSKLIKKKLRGKGGCFSPKGTIVTWPLNLC